MNMIPVDEKKCENCLHWCMEDVIAYAYIHGGLRRVGQCRNDDDQAPFADMEKCLAAVFTAPEGTCGAFEVHPDVQEEFDDQRETCASLDRDLKRDAWQELGDRE